MTSPWSLLIGDRRQATETVSPVVNPHSGSKIADVCLGGAVEIGEATALAVRTFPTLGRSPAHLRASSLEQVATLLSARRDELANTITAESGKPITDAQREVTRAMQTFLVAAEEARRLGGEVIAMDRAPGMECHLGMVRRFPVGPILGITPFNFPLNLVAHKVAPAIAAGNPIVLKPAPQTPLTALLLGEIILRTALPPGSISVIPCSNDIAEVMVRDARFKVLSFTGSAAVGWMLKGRCGKKRTLLELGGNAGVIIEPDADLELAVHRCTSGGFSYSGQTCISVQRIMVHEAVFDHVVGRLVESVSRLKVGDPMDETTVIGPLIDEAAARRVERWIEEAVAGGARLLTGGKRLGSVVQPTVLTDVTSDMKVSCQEVFGPVVTVSRYRSFPDAVASLNDSDFGLQAGIFTRDIDKIFAAYRDLEVGAVLANEVPTWRADHMPYGGVKDSGLGREGIRYAIEEMTELKLLVLNTRNPGQS